MVYCAWVMLVCAPKPETTLTAHLWNCVTTAKALVVTLSTALVCCMATASRGEDKIPDSTVWHGDEAHQIRIYP